MIRILALEKDRKWQRVLAEAMPSGSQIIFMDKNEALNSIENEQYHTVILDVPHHANGLFSLLPQIKKALPQIPIIVTSELEKTELIVKAIKLGAYDFIGKPYSGERVRHLIQQALDERRCKNEIDYLRHEQDVVYNFDRIVAVSLVMKGVLNTLIKFSKTDGTLLMTGETGTGKSFLSGSVHFNSHRRTKAFVKVNCANIPETLLESELFGHEKGAFTGADKMRIGRFEQAHGGTLFLDEIGEMSLPLQAKMLRVLEDKAFERVGGNQTIHSNVRIIAATNRKLKDLIEKGQFREDLYYRISVLTVYLPPLRERRDCIEPLAIDLLSRLSRSLGKKIQGFKPSAMERLASYSWPGNIRQLSNTIERAVILEEGPQIREESLTTLEPVRATPTEGATIVKSMSLAVGEKEMIIEALAESLWIQKDAATKLGISPRALNYKIKKYEITHQRWRRHKS
jgi:DNA-binding NtrC family response regulator